MNDYRQYRVWDRDSAGSPAKVAGRVQAEDSVPAITETLAGVLRSPAGRLLRTRRSRFEISIDAAAQLPRVRPRDGRFWTSKHVHSLRTEGLLITAITDDRTYKSAAKPPEVRPGMAAFLGNLMTRSDRLQNASLGTAITEDRTKCGVGL